MFRIITGVDAFRFVLLVVWPRTNEFGCVFVLGPHKPRLDLKFRSNITCVLGHSGECMRTKTYFSV